MPVLEANQAPAREPTASSATRAPNDARTNVAPVERAVSIAAGAIIAALGIARRSLAGLATAGFGGALIERGVSGECAAYRTLGVDTAHRAGGEPAESQVERRGILVEQAFLIGRPAPQLYAFWRDFANLPRVLSHVERVEVLDEKRSRWTAKAPRIAGGAITWDAEITADEPDRLITWRSLPGAPVATVGEIRFTPALGERGTEVHVRMEYVPPAGRLGHWLANLTGTGARSQIRENLRDFKRLMEVGELPTTAGQPRGTCRGHGKRER